MLSHGSKVKRKKKQDPGHSKKLGSRQVRRSKNLEGCLRLAKGVRSDLVVVGFSPASGSGLNSALGSDKLGIRCLCTPKAGPWLGIK